MQFQAKLVKDGHVLANLTGDIELKITGGRKAWLGHFRCPSDCDPVPGSDYYLLLDDGRSGRIRILSMPSTPLGRMAEFQIKGTFQ